MTKITILVTLFIIPCNWSEGYAEESANRWMAIAGSSSSVTTAIKLAKSLRVRWPDSTVVASSDCQNLRPRLYLTVVSISKTREDVVAAVNKLRSQISDAYPRECAPKPNTRILLGLPLVHPSIEEVPENNVNWTDEDRISMLVSFPKNGYLWIVRRYESKPNDPREGRRESVYYFTRTLKDALELDIDCTDPSYSRAGKYLALSCAREVAAENLLHQTKLMDVTSGKEILSVSRCNNPEFIGPTEFVCFAEEVDKEGKLQTKSKRVRVP